MIVYMAHPIDIHIGKRLHMARTLRGFTQKALGQEIGVSGRKIGDYEKAKSKLAVSELCDIATAFDVTLYNFFQELDAFRLSLELGVKLEAGDLELIEYFHAIQNTETQDILRKMIRHFAESAD